MKHARGFFGILTIVTLFSVASFSQNAFPYEQQPLVKAFEKRAVKYEKSRDKIERRIGRPSKDATPEQITAYKFSLQRAIQADRRNAKQGEFFTPTAADIIRKMIKNEFKGWEASELRKTVLEAETQGVPVKVNVPYPDYKELVEMSPTLLLSLPQLPKPLRYRFIGRNLVIIDRDNALIIDYMTNALP